MIEHLTVLGGGSAGFIAAITCKKRIPGLRVTLLRSPGIGIIGVGEGQNRTQFNVPCFRHGQCNRRGRINLSRTDWEAVARRDELLLARPCKRNNPGSLKMQDSLLSHGKGAAPIPFALSLCGGFCLSPTSKSFRKADGEKNCRTNGRSRSAQE